MGFLGKYAKRYWRLFALAVVCLSVEAFCDLLQPTIMARIVDDGVRSGDLHFVLSLGGLMLGVAAIGALSAVGRNIIASTVSQKLGMGLRADLFGKILGLPKVSTDSLDTASLITRLTNDVTQVQNFANGTMRIFVKAPLMCIGGIVMATLLSPRLAVAVYCSVALVGVLIYFNLRIGYPLFAKIQERLDGINSVLREYLSGVRVIKAYNNQRHEEARFVAANDELSGTTMGAMRVMAVFSPAVSFTMNVAVVAVLWYGGYLKAGGHVQVGKIMAFVNYMTQILMSLNIITNAFNMFVRAKASARRVGEVMQLESGQAGAGGTRPQPSLAGSPGGVDIAFSGVSFSYAGSSEPALSDISFSCRAGETVGVIGSTGCGKSTLVNLLLRFYDATSGQITVNGADIRSVDIGWLRSVISVVPQRSLLFTGTIAENIRWGKEDASMGEVEAAAAAAQADEFIRGFRDGYETYMGQGGVNLSGGQKQRVSIARALIKRPLVLIMDDSTSAVDLATEARMRGGIGRFATGMGCFIVAQRITSVMDLDKILVLDDGRVQGFGTHDELMESCEVFREIYRSQIGGELHGRQAQ